MTPDRLTRADDPRLQPFTALRDPELLRDRGWFVAESREVVRRLLTLGRYPTRSLVCTPTVFEELGELVTRADVGEVCLAERDVISQVSGYQVHRGCLALGERGPVDELGALAPKGVRIVLALEDVTDPDNVGGIFRSAVAFGASGVLLSPRCADPLYRKAIRTSMATTLMLPWRVSEDFARDLGALRDRGFQTVATTPAQDAVELHELSPATAESPMVVLVGNEGEGLKAETLGVADVRVKIPMNDAIDSLNATVAASIVTAHLASLGNRVDRG